MNKTVSLIALLAIILGLSSSFCPCNLRGRSPTKDEVRRELYQNEAEELFPDSRRLNFGKNPFCEKKRHCERKWYCLWLCKKCKTEKRCCYRIHRYD